jgi:hypothetical protein
MPPLSLGEGWGEGAMVAGKLQRCHAAVQWSEQRYKVWTLRIQLSPANDS